MTKTPEELHTEAIARGDIIEDDDTKKKPEDDDPEDDDDVNNDDDDDLDDDDDDKPGDDPDDGIQVPKARFDKSRKAGRIREEALERRIKELEGKGKKPEITIAEMEAEIEELEDQHENLLLEGEVDKSKAIRRQMNVKRNAVIDRRISEKSNAMGAAAVQQVRYDNQLAAFEIKYPAMNEDAVEYDEAVAGEVGTLMNAFQSSGMSLVGALNKAVHYVFRDAPAAKDEDDDTADEVRKARKLKARKKALRAVKKTPTNLKDVGRNSDKAGRDDGLPDPLKMTQDQFDKLTEKQLAELREDKMVAKD